MAMTVILYKNRSAKNVVSKKLQRVGQITGGFYDSQSLATPSIRFDNNLSPDSFNYVYIEKLHRYYYVSTMTKPGNGSFGGIMNLECDVLMSYKDAILSSQVEVVDSKDFNNLVSGSRVQVESRSELEVQEGEKIEGRHAIFISV